MSDQQSRTEIRELTQAAIGVIEAPGRATVISAENPLPAVARDATSDAPPFELFHFGFSICSHKVRAVLSELGLEFGSNQFAGPTKYENYTPEYVRLRLQSDVAKTSKFVSGFSGASSVDDDGFDPLVVPTLVDNQAGKVLADSKLICLYLVNTYGGGHDLLPDDLKDRILQEMDVVDQTPHVALLYGADPEGDTRPTDIQSRMPGIHQIKFESIKGHMSSVQGDANLMAAYKAKLEKEKNAEAFVVDGTAMQDATQLAERLIADLETTLQASTGTWLFDDRFTLADLVWGVSLLRLDYLGKSQFWDGDTPRPNVKAYYQRLAARPCLINAIVDWPGSRKRLQTS
ncbi:glutathione S-transferase family protein [Yoonia sp. SS1-5]|uniref:Glutathione S-transferase family protein n=1 Tax=Yoonia rhodophyticola TaxID=3137370 RepID=A0AAN0MAG0_9RHOB